MRDLSVAGSIPGTLGSLIHVMQNPRYRRVAAVVGILYLAIYLYSLRHIIWLPASVLSTFPAVALEIADNWPAKVWKAIAPFTYEPVAVVYLARRLALFLAVPNLLLGVLLGLLVGLNVALAAAHFNMHQTCRRPGVGLLGTLPGLLTGFTCCAPTVGLALGANSVLALIALRSYFVPASLLILGAGLLWGARRFAAQYQVASKIAHGTAK